jgi:hypothetical protein
MMNSPTCSEKEAAARRNLEELAIPLEILANLVFLSINDAEHPDNIRLYAHMAEQHLNVLRQCLFPSEQRQETLQTEDVADSDSQDHVP